MTVNLSDLLGAGGGGGYDDVAELGSSFAQGTAASTIVASAANVNGVVITSFSLSAQLRTQGRLLAGSDVIFAMGEGTGTNTTWVSGMAFGPVKVPSGVEISVDKTTSIGSLVWHISYEVL